jgi:ubiquinone biosynthesis protein COQ4
MKKIRAIVSGLRLLHDPSQLDRVFEISDGIASPKLMKPIVDELRKDPRAVAAFAVRKRLGRPDLDALGRLPEDTLGRVFADHMRANGLSLDAIPSLPAADDVEFFRAHMFETHDVWHAVTGFSTDLAGELGLQAFYLAQLPGRFPAVLLGGGLLNTALFAWGDREPRMREIVRGWLLGRRAQPLFGADWASLWSTSIDEVRARFGIDHASVDPVVEARAAVPHVLAA